jgi:hypothetical protein
MNDLIVIATHNLSHVAQLSHLLSSCPNSIVKKFMETPFTCIFKSLYISRLHIINSVPLTVPRISVPANISSFINPCQSTTSLVPFLLQNMVKKFVGHSLHQIANQPLKGRKLSHACPICPTGIVKKFVITPFTRISTSLNLSQLHHIHTVPLTVPRILVPTHISVFVNHCQSAVSRVPHLVKYMVKKFVGHSLHLIANQPIKDRKLSHAHSTFFGFMFQNPVPNSAFALKNPKSKALERL